MGLDTFFLLFAVVLLIACAVLVAYKEVLDKKQAYEYLKQHAIKLGITPIRGETYEDLALRVNVRLHMRAMWQQEEHSVANWIDGGRRLR